MSGVLRTVFILVAFWLMLSGRTDTLFLGFGLISALITMGIAEQLRSIAPDQMSSPFRIGVFVRYCAWLFAEIVTANIEVVRAVLQAKPDLNPSLTKYHASADTDLGRAILANSITLTPGTLVVEMIGSTTLIHTLFDPLDDPRGAFDEMDKQSARITCKDMQS